MDSTKMKFEFDFDEVFEGIKQGVIRELAETNFDEAKSEAVNSIKNDIKKKISVTYSDECALMREIKEEIKEKVFASLIKEVSGCYLNQFDEYLTAQLCKNPDRLKTLEEEIKESVSNELYKDLFSTVRNDASQKAKEIVMNMMNVANNNTVNISGSKDTITKDEIEKLRHRDAVLSALEAGGVDNWEWYGESLSALEDDE